MKINWKYFAGSLFAFLGFGGCIRIDIGGGLAMYGQPTAHYKLIGNVKGPDGKPVEGIQAVFVPREDGAYPHENDTLYSDAQGHFEKGRLKGKTLTRNALKMEQTRKGDGAWYEGAYTVSADVTLDKDE